MGPKAHDPATYNLVPSGWHGTVTVGRPGEVVFHHPCHLNCPSEGKRCMICKTLWPCDIARTVNAPSGDE